MATQKPTDSVKRSKQMAVGFAVAALLIGGGTTAGVLSYWSKLKARAALNEEEKKKVDPVVVTTAAIPVGKAIQENMLKIVEFPHGTAPKGVLTEIPSAIGRVARVMIVDGVPLFEAMLAPKTAGSGEGALIPPGLRAMSVKVNEVIGVAGFIHPDDYVDVLALVKPGKGEEPRSKVVLQRLRVFGVGEQTEAPDPADKKAKKKATKVTVVTVLVTPDQGERLAMATSSGKITLALRGGLDEEEVTTAGVTAKGLLDDATKTEAETPAVEVAQKDNPPKRTGSGGGGGSRPTTVASNSGGGGKAGKADSNAETIEVFHGNKLEQRTVKPAGGVVQEVLQGNRVEERNTTRTVSKIN